MWRKIALCIISLLLLHGISQACVGKTIFVGYVDNKPEELLGNIFSRLISERTGTTVKLKKYTTASALFQATVSGEVDIYVLSDAYIKETVQMTDKEKAKTEFNVKYNLVWLKPLNDEQADVLIPVIRKDTLKKFPALPKLIEKLNGIITSQKIKDLAGVMEKKGMKDTVKDFLKDQGLI